VIKQGDRVKHISTNQFGDVIKIEDKVFTFKPLEGPNLKCQEGDLKLITKRADRTGPSGGTKGEQGWME
jgi:dsDNA-specific endonuclease/ATPase MutS2